MTVAFSKLRGKERKQLYMRGKSSRKASTCSNHAHKTRTLVKNARPETYLSLFSAKSSSTPKPSTSCKKRMHICQVSAVNYARNRCMCWLHGFLPMLHTLDTMYLCRPSSCNIFVYQYNKRLSWTCSQAKDVLAWLSPITSAFVLKPALLRSKNNAIHCTKMCSLEWCSRRPSDLMYRAKNSVLTSGSGLSKGPLPFESCEAPPLHYNLKNCSLP